MGRLISIFRGGEDFDHPCKKKSHGRIQYDHDLEWELHDDFKSHIPSQDPRDGKIKIIFSQMVKGVCEECGHEKVRGNTKIGELDQKRVTISIDADDIEIDKMYTLFP